MTELIELSRYEAHHNDSFKRIALLQSCYLSYTLLDCSEVAMTDLQYVYSFWLPGAAVFNGMIYAVGGRDDTTELSSAEKFNPATNQWSPVVAMNSRRSGVRE